MRFGLGLGNGLGIKNPLAFGGSGAIPFESDLALSYAERSGLDLIETKLGLNAKILPSCAKFGNALYLTKQVVNFGSADAYGEFETKIYYDGSSTPIYAIASSSDNSTSRYFILSITAGIPRISAREGTTFTNIVFGTALSIGWHVIKYGSTGSAYYINVDGTDHVLTASSGANDGKWLNLLTLRANFTIGVWKNSSYSYSKAHKIAYVKYTGSATLKNTWYLTGAGNYEYDVIGGSHMTWVGTGKKGYDIAASTQLLEVGYSLYTNPNGGKEYVPYIALNTPYNADSFLTDYDHAHDISTEPLSHNMAPSAIDFNYGDVVNSNLNIFDRSNATIYGASATAATDYDSVNPFRFDILSITDPYLHYTWRNDGYKGIQFSNIINDYDNITKLSGVLVYSNDKKNSAAEKIAKYCTINKFPCQIDVNGNLEFLSEVNASFYGLNETSTPYESFDSIKLAVDNSRITKVVIGDNPISAVSASQPIVARKNGQDIDVNCIMSPMLPLSGVLSANVSIGDVSFITPDASLFNVGEWIGVTDDNALHGLDYYNTYRAWTEEIVAINGNVITLGHKSPYAYTTAANARLSHLQNVIIVEADNVDINVIGEIDGIKDSLVQLHPVREYNTGISEQQRAGCGVTFWKTTGGSINGIVRNGLLHCLAATGDELHDVVGLTLKSGLRLYDGHDKCCVFKYVDNYVIETGVVFSGARWEDGMTFYYGCNNGTVGTITSNNNNRYGFAFNNACIGITVTGLNLSGNQDYGLEVAGASATIGIVNTDDSVLLTDVWDTFNNVSITQLNITGANKGLTLPVLYLQGGLTATTIESLIITSCTGIGVLAASFNGQFPTVVINGGGIYSHTGVKTQIEAGSSITFNNFDGL